MAKQSAATMASYLVDEQESVAVTDNLLRGYLGYRLKRAYVPIHADARATVERFGLRITTSSALHIVVENPGLSQSQLAHALNIERSRVVLLVDELEKAGLIVRDKVPRDRRSYALRATHAGSALLGQVSEALQHHESRILAALSEQEKKQLATLLAKIHASTNSL